MSFPVDLKFRVGDSVVAPSAGRAAVLAAIEQSNRRVRLEDLVDHLNPEIIDPAKAEAFLTTLSQLPADALRPLAGRTLYLNYPGLMIGASAPTREAVLARPFKIEIAEMQGDLALARLILPIDCPLARERVTEARTRLKVAEEEVTALEGRQTAAAGKSEEKRKVLTALSAARERRFAIASAWRQNAEAWTKCGEDGSTAKAGLAAASKAAETYAVPRSKGMP